MRSKSPASTQRGILLLEALVAILIVSFGILGLVALWANSIKNASEAQFRSDASYLANELISEMWLSRPITLAYTPPTAWTTRVASALPGGEGTVDMANDGNGLLQATINVKWTVPGHDQHTYQTVARINGAGPM